MNIHYRVTPHKDIDLKKRKAIGLYFDERLIQLLLPAMLTIMALAKRIATNITSSCRT